MQVSHHPSPALLVDQARGALEPARALVVATHLSVCADCRSIIRLAEGVGGAFLRAEAPTAMTAGSRDRVMAQLETPAPAEATPAPRAAPAGWIEVPREVREAAHRRRRWRAPGIWVADVSGSRRGQRAFLLRVGAGMAVPPHGHKGLELMCVVKGMVRDGGRVLGPGDVLESDEAIDHSPVNIGPSECVCLLATDAPFKPRDWVGRLFQPLLGI